MLIRSFSSGDHLFCFRGRPDLFLAIGPILACCTQKYKVAFETPDDRAVAAMETPGSRAFVTSLSLSFGEYLNAISLARPLS